MKTESVLKIEKFFNKSLTRVINEEHIEKKISLNELASRCGVSRQVLTYSAKKLGLTTRTIKEATKLTKNKGDKHFLFGKTKETSRIAKMHSERMTKNNPIHSPSAAENRALKISKQYRKNLLPQEKIFKDLLNSLAVDFEIQKPVGKYVLDFFIPSIGLAIEIDSQDKWGKIRRSKAEIRDKTLKLEFKIDTLRICRTELKNIQHILNILHTHNVVF